VSVVVPAHRTTHRPVVQRGVRLLILGATALGCGSDSTAPAAVSSVEVTSPIGNRMAVGRTAQLTATARTADGHSVSASFTWSSSAPGVAQVNTSGLASGLVPGDATISAEADGVRGSVAMAVISADLDAIAPVLNDPFTTALVANLTSAVRARVETALAQCKNGAAQGNFATIESCLIDARAEVNGAADPTDRALLATLALFFDHVEGLLNG